MVRSKYLIIGGSHAGLAALEEIRVHDAEGSLTIVNRENHLPYSPTALPYLISGKIQKEKIFLRDEAYFHTKGVTYIKGRSVTSLDTKTNTITLDDGSELGFEKLLIGSGSEPALPSIPGLDKVSFLILRTLDGAEELMKAMTKARSAVILGAGLIGMHVAECLAQKGAKVEVAEMLPQILPGYFDKECSELIRRVFATHGVNCHTGNPAVHVEQFNGKVGVTLRKGQKLEGSILLVATGVKAHIDFLAGSGIKMDEGVVVDDTMQTSIDNIWAAGDVTQAGDFFSDRKILNAILPDAAIQGKIAGAAMAGVAIQSSYSGSIPMNTFNFFGNRAFSIGLNNLEDRRGHETDTVFLPTANHYQKMVFKNGRLVGMTAVNSVLDPGIILNLIRRKIDLTEEKAEFVRNPVDMSRRLMWKAWRKEHL